MNVSTKSEYGLRALIYLASNSEREAIPAREIAERWSVPVKYLEQILKSLKEAGLVVSQVGVGGGYR
ncbi:MAG TPA: Rrf2 family transcriptional regulator, partial [Blastocatellia bacterium]|nr:Rrf2 family transcriptional regulator [Blastocatellia bacterium]